MSKLTLAGIRRGNQFSPNHIGNDAAIFALTAQHLRKLGCDVNEYIESDLLLQDPKEKGIFNMVRDWKSIHKLQELEDKNYFVVNSGYGIEKETVKGQEKEIQRGFGSIVQSKDGTQNY